MAGAGGPGFLRLLPRGSRRVDDRSVRTGVRAVARGRRAGGLFLRRAAPGLGAHGALCREGDGPRAAVRRPRREEVLLRAGELHARPAAGGRRSARAEELLRRRRPQLDRDPERGRPRPRAGALDHPRPSGRGRNRLQHRPAARLAGESGLPAYAHRRVAGHGLPVPLPDALHADGARCHHQQKRRSSRCPGDASRGSRGGQRSTAPRERAWSSWTCRSCRNSASRVATRAAC